MDSQNINRLCPYSIEGDIIIIQIEASPEIVVGAEFKLYKKDSLDYLKTWKIGCQDGEVSRIGIDRDVHLINKHILTWQILCCTKVVDKFKGKINLDFFQDGKKLKCNIPTFWNLDNIPPCAIKRYSKFTESLLFVARI